jgi:hypothetical protein
LITIMSGSRAVKLYTAVVYKRLPKNKWNKLHSAFQKGCAQ